MDIQPDRPKVERFARFLERLRVAPPSCDFESAYRQLSDILNDVENTMTSIPYDPANWQTDGRMYPPQIESIRDVAGHPLVCRQSTTDPVTVRLRALRLSRGLTQAELAKRLHVNQAAVSKIESRTDLHLQTLREVITAMGGRLVVLARFPDGESELCFDDVGGFNRNAQTN